jgi:hypothetical protein
MKEDNKMPIYYNGSGLEYLQPLKKDLSKEHIVKPDNAVNHLQFPVFPYFKV